MKRFIHSLLLTILGIFMSLNHVSSQEIGDHQILYGIEMNYGMTIPFTDIKRYNYIPSIDPPIVEIDDGIGLSGFILYNNKWSINVEYIKNTIKGYHPYMNLNFKTNNNIYSILIGYKTNPASFYISSPLYDVKEKGLVFHNFSLLPQLGINYISASTILNQTITSHSINVSTEDYHLGKSHPNSLGINIGLKVLFQISKGRFDNDKNNIYYYIGNSFTYAFSDDLDGFRKPNSINDIFSYSSIGIIYIFNK